MSWSAVASPDATASINNIGTPYEHGIEFALSADGTTGVIAWMTGSSGSEIVKASRLVSGSWTSPENVVTGLTQASIAGVSIDGLGKPIIVVTRVSVALATLHRWDGGWGQVGPEFARSDANGGIYATSASQPMPIGMVNLTANTRDVILMYTGAGGIRTRRNLNGGWQGETLFSSTATGATLGQLHKASNGTTLHAVNRLADNRMIHHRSTDTGATFPTATVISDAGTVGTHIRSSLLSNDNILAVWSTTGGDTAWSLYNGTSWTAPALVTGPTAAFASGNVQFMGDTLSYGKTVNGVTQIFAKRFTNGAWGAERQITTSATNVSIHTLGCTASGAECFIAYSSSSSQALTLIRRVNGNWYDPQVITSATGFYPQAYVNGSRLAVFSGAKIGISVLDTSAARTLSTRASVTGSIQLRGTALRRQMTSLTDLYETSVGNAILRGQTLTGPSTLYAALFTSNPGETGSLAGEVSGGGYQRTAISFGAPSPAGAFSNSATCLFPEATASWGTITAIGLMTAQTGGDLIMVFPLINASGESISQVINSGDRPEIAPGDLRASFD